MPIKRKTASTAEFEWPIIMADASTFPALVTVGDTPDGKYMCCIEDSSDLSEAYDIYDGYPSLEEAIGAALAQFDVDDGEKRELVDFATNELRGASRKTALTLTQYPDGWDDSDPDAPFDAYKKYSNGFEAYIYGDGTWDLFDQDGGLYDQSSTGEDCFECAVEIDGIMDKEFGIMAKRTSAKRSMRKKAQSSWEFDDGMYMITVDDYDVAIVEAGGQWKIEVYDFDGYSAIDRLFGEVPPEFSTPQEAVDWANGAVGWIGDWRFPRIASRKRTYSRSNRRRVASRRRVADWQQGVTDYVDGTEGWVYEGAGCKMIIEPESNGDGSFYGYIYENGQDDYSYANWYESLDDAKADLEDQLPEYTARRAMRKRANWGAQYSEFKEWVGQQDEPMTDEMWQGSWRVFEWLEDTGRLASRKRSMRKRAVWDWQPDDGFSGELTHYEGDYAYVVARDWDNPGEWILQVFDTDSEYSGGELKWEQYGPYYDMDTAQEMAERWGTDSGMKVVSRRSAGAKRRSMRKKANRPRKARQ